MKMHSLIISVFATVIFIAVSTSCSSSKKLTDSDVQRKVSQAIGNRDFSIEVNQMLPMMGRAQHLTSLYSLKVKSDSVYSYLPFFGRAYSVPYGGGQGLIFDGLVQEYHQKKNDKGVYRISFKSQTPEDTYVFSIEIYDNGSSQIRVNSNNRQSIAFVGELKLQNSDK